MKIKETEFTIVDLSLTMGTQSIKPKLHVTSKYISFNTAFCKQLAYPAYVDMYINTDERKVVFKPLTNKTATCRNFYQPRKKSTPNGYVNWSGAKIVNAMNNIFKHGDYVGEVVDGFIVFEV